MKSLYKCLFMFASLMLLSVSASFASPEAKNIGISKEELRMRLLNKAMPRLQKRFCHLKLRPDAMVVIIGLASVEWSIDRMCESKLPEVEQ